MRTLPGTLPGEQFLDQILGEQFVGNDPWGPVPGTVSIASSVAGIVPAEQRKEWFLKNSFRNRSCGQQCHELLLPESSVRNCVWGTVPGTVPGSSKLSAVFFRRPRGSPTGRGIAICCMKDVMHIVNKINTSMHAVLKKSSARNEQSVREETHSPQTPGESYLRFWECSCGVYSRDGAGGGTDALRWVRRNIGTSTVNAHGSSGICTFLRRYYC